MSEKQTAKNAIRLLHKKVFIKLIRKNVWHDLYAHDELKESSIKVSQKYFVPSLFFRQQHHGLMKIYISENLKNDLNIHLRWQVHHSCDVIFDMLCLLGNMLYELFLVHTWLGVCPGMNVKLNNIFRFSFLINLFSCIREKCFGNLLVHPTMKNLHNEACSETSNSHCTHKTSNL
jgi:hypothetical protein